MVGKILPWEKMIVPKKERGLGVRNLPIIPCAVAIKRVAFFWGQGTSILINWTKDRYVRNQSLEAIKIRPKVDSPPLEAAASSKRENRRASEL